MTSLSGVPSRSALLGAILVVCAVLAVAEASWDAQEIRSSNLRQILDNQYISPSDPKKPLSTGAIIGISFAAAMAGILLIGVLAAIFVPGVRHLVATNASDTSITQRSVLSAGSRANLNLSSVERPQGATEPRNGTISTTTSSSESDDERADVEMAVKKPKRVKKSGTRAKKSAGPKKVAAPAAESSDDDSDSNYDTD